MWAITVDEIEDDTSFKIQSDTCEINLRFAPAEVERLLAVRAADWDTRRSIAAGHCAIGRAWWSAGAGGATVLVGDDDEAWDIAVGPIPLAVLLEAVNEAVRLERN